MKRLMAVMLAVLMLFFLTACGGKNEVAVDTGVVEVSDTLVRSVYNEATGSYSNAYTQITITPPGDWYTYIDNDLVMAYFKGAVTGDEFAMWSSADYKNKQLIPDIAFQDMATKNNFSVVYVNLEQLEYAEYMDEDTVLSMIIQSFVEQGRILQKSGDTVTLGDKEFRFLEFSDMKTSWYIAVKRQDNYAIVLTATDNSGAGFEMFSSFVG